MHFEATNENTCFCLLRYRVWFDALVIIVFKPHLFLFVLVISDASAEVTSIQK